MSQTNKFTIKIHTDKQWSKQDIEKWIKKAVARANDSRYRGFGWREPIKKVKVKQRIECDN